jgi:hypothetical protein
MKIDYSKVLDKVKFWKKTIENVKNFTGSSPPAIFVGRAFYPKVWVGILAPPMHSENAEILDFPEKWYEEKASIEKILDYRSQLVYSRFKVSTVKRPIGRLIETTQELAMAKKSTDVEIELKKNPVFKLRLSNWFTPIGNPAPILNARLTENVKVERKVEYIISDSSLKAQEAIIELYKHKIPISRLQKIFSAGLLGLSTQRKFVPTRWSITAVDDIIGKNLMQEIKDYPTINEYQLFSNEYLANHFEILLIPQIYSFELIEAWDLDRIPSIGSDFEPYWGRESYANVTGGAFYAARLAVLEYLSKIRRQAAILIVREVKPEYYAPVGVWKIRETIRDAFNLPFEKFDSLEQAVKRICEKMLIGEKWVSKSKLLRILKEQKKITQF